MNKNKPFFAKQLVINHKAYTSLDINQKINLKNALKNKNEEFLKKIYDLIEIESMGYRKALMILKK